MSLIQPIEDLYPVQPLIMNHDIMHWAAAGARGDHLYSGRALAISSPLDIVQLHPALMAEYPAICEHYSRLGLAYSNQIVWNVNPEEQRNYTQYETSYYYFGPEQHRVACRENWFQVVEYINSRNHFIELAREFGMRTPWTQCFDSSREIDKTILGKLQFPCLIKAAVSVAGAGTYRCENSRELRRRLAYFGRNTPLQIQQQLNISEILNLQYQVCGSRLKRLAITSKLQPGTRHSADSYPTPHKAWFSVDVMARWLFSQGIRGVFSFDVAVVVDECGTDYLPIACVPRFNSAAYAAMVASKLDMSRWQLRPFTTRFRHLVDLPLGGLEYSAMSQSGVVILNWGTVQSGQLQILIAGTPEQQDSLRLELLKRL